MKKRFGFTLAEVLITLGIIGVVAAMTIPTLIANTNSAKFRSQFKKSISTLNQAGLMGEAQYDINYGNAAAACSATPGNDKPTDSSATICGLLNGTLTGQTVSTTRENAPSATQAPNVQPLATGFYYYSLADGSMVAVPNAAKSSNCTLVPGQIINATWLTDARKNACVGYIDVNGRTLPNEEVRCGAGTTGSGRTVTDSSAAFRPDDACSVPNDSAHMKDIFPVVFHDATVEPATDAAKAVLATAK